MVSPHSTSSLQNSAQGAFAAESFPGQQEGERILYVARSHWVREFIFALKVVLVVGGILALRWLVADLLPLSEEAIVRSYLITALIGALSLLYFRFYCQNSCTYITDRRIIRFEGAIPAFQTRRALFWNDVTKIQSRSPSWIMQLMKVGHIVAVPSVGPTTQDVTVKFVYYYEDLAAYLEKIVFTFRTKPEELPGIREFVPKPKGQRYPYERAV